MEIFYPADSERLPVETIQELNGQIFDGWDDGDMPTELIDNEFESLTIITEEEFLQSELEF